jgi:hypothetical protein
MSSSSIAPWLGQEGMGPEGITSSFNFQPHLRHHRLARTPCSGTPGARRSGLSQLRDMRVRISRLVSSPSRTPSDPPAMHVTPFLHMIHVSS